MPGRGKLQLPEFPRRQQQQLQVGILGSDCRDLTIVQDVWGETKSSKTPQMEQGERFSRCLKGNLENQQCLQDLGKEGSPGGDFSPSLLEVAGFLNFFLSSRRVVRGVLPTEGP